VTNQPFSTHSAAFVPQSRDYDELRDNAFRALCRNQVSMLLPNRRRISLDNLLLLDYGTAGGDFRVFKFANLDRSIFKAPTLQSHNEILHYFNRNSLPWCNMDTVAYKRVGTKAVPHTRAAIGRTS
jgi:hypothetical protein